MHTGASSSGGGGGGGGNFKDSLTKLEEVRQL